MNGGVVAGFPVVDVKVTLYDGSYHEVDSSELAFKIAGSIAFKEACQKADPVILEPIMKVCIIVPDEYMKRMTKKAAAADYLRRNAAKKRLLEMSALQEEEVLRALDTAPQGLTEELAEEARQTYGSNVVAQGRRDSVLKRLLGAFVNPFTTILLVLALVSVFTDIVLVAPEDRNYATVLIIAAMAATDFCVWDTDKIERMLADGRACFTREFEA